MCEKVQELRAARENGIKTTVNLILDTRWSYVASRSSRFAPGTEKTLLTEKESAWIPEPIWRLSGKYKQTKFYDSCPPECSAVSIRVS